MTVSRRRYVLFAAITVAASLLVGLVAAEVGLRVVRHTAETSGALDEGMFSYHPRLGWVLEPEWRGRHRHQDFDVVYTTNRYGHRGTPAPAVKPPDQTRYAYIGDSFTFAMGVEDEAAFTEILNARFAPEQLHINYGHPGYSTDQAVLFAEERVFLIDPDVVVLVVYLGNDLIDNTLPFPIQIDFAKPYFALVADELELRNVPVPQRSKPAALRERTFASLILAGQAVEPGLLARSEILRRLGYRPSTPDISATFDRLAPSVELFGAIIDRLAGVTEAYGSKLAVMLLPGKSFVHDAGGYSGQYQDFIRRAVLEGLSPRGIPVLDAATALRQAHASGRRNLFHPNEGHLTSEGNRFIADLIAAELIPAVSP